jgi:hypothetical protein
VPPSSHEQASKAAQLPEGLRPSSMKALELFQVAKFILSREAHFHRLKLQKAWPMRNFFGGCEHVHISTKAIQTAAHYFNYNILHVNHSSDEVMYAIFI